MAASQPIRVSTSFSRFPDAAGGKKPRARMPRRLPRPSVMGKERDSGAGARLVRRIYPHRLDEGKALHPRPVRSLGSKRKTGMASLPRSYPKGRDRISRFVTLEPFRRRAVTNGRRSISPCSPGLACSFHCVDLHLPIVLGVGDVHLLADLEIRELDR